MSGNSSSSFSDVASVSWTTSGLIAMSISPVSAQGLTERFQAAPQQPSDRALRPPHLLSDLEHGEALHVAEDDRVALVLGQRFHRLRHPGELLALLSLLARRGLAVGQQLLQAAGGFSQHSM